MEIRELRENASALKQAKQAYLNDTFLWVQLARKAVQQLPDTSFEYIAPKAGKTGVMRKVSRSNGAMIKERMINKDIYASAFSSMVSAVEDYLSKVMVWILSTDNSRIKCTISGVSFSKDISIVEIIDKDKETIIDEIIYQRVYALFYAAPLKQLEYFDKALSIKVDEDVWRKWIEIKARRDLWVHNAGVVNQIYLDKTGAFAMYSDGEEAIIDDEYFCACVGVLKTMIGRMDRDIRRNFRL